MAFNLEIANLTGGVVVDRPGGRLPAGNDWVGNYTYENYFEPHILKTLHFANGRGKLFKFTEALARKRNTYASDIVQHQEMGRLHNKLSNVTVTGNTFTFTAVPGVQERANVRVNDTILIYDGDTEFQATVTAVTNATTFVATNDAAPGTPFTVAGAVDVIIDFSNSFAKGTDGFTEGRQWYPRFFYNYSHILKEHFVVNNSDMAHLTWIKMPDGSLAWYSLDMQNTEMLFDNKREMTMLYHRRKAQGNNRGMNGLVPTIENHGNIANEYLETLDDLREILFRQKQHGLSIEEMTMWTNLKQQFKFTDLIGGINAHYAGGANFGTFDNDQERGRKAALNLGFNSVKVENVTFHTQCLDVLDDVTLLGTEKAEGVAPAAIIVPMGSTPVTIDGTGTTMPYLNVMHRKLAGTDRFRTVVIKGNNYADKQDGNKDVTTADFTAEQTLQLVGANAFYVVRQGDFY